MMLAASIPVPLWVLGGLLALYIVITVVGWIQKANNRNQPKPLDHSKASDFWDAS